MSKTGTMAMLTGDNNFIQVKGYGIDNLHLKLESLNPAGSVKFKTAIGLIGSFEAKNAIKDDSIIIESSSGNLGVALSVICAERSYKFTCVVDPNTNAQNIRYMEALGATIVCVSKRDENGGYLGSRIGYIKDLMARDSRYIWTNQYENPANVKIHAEMTGRSIDRHFGRLDYVFIGAGTTGTLMGCLQHLRRARPHTRIVAVDSVGSVTFNLPPGPRFIPGLGSSQVSNLFSASGLHAMVAVPEVATIRACRQLARRQGILAGGSTGTVLSAVQAWRDRFASDDVVVAIAPDGGERYLSTVYDDEWVARRFGAGALGSDLDDPTDDRCVTIMPGTTGRTELQYA